MYEPLGFRIFAQHSATLMTIIATVIGSAMLVMSGEKSVTLISLLCIVGLLAARWLGHLLNRLLEVPLRWPHLAAAHRLSKRKNEIVPLYWTAPAQAGQIMWAPAHLAEDNQALAVTSIARELGWDEARTERVRRPWWGLWMPRLVSRIECRNVPTLETEFAPLRPLEPMTPGLAPIRLGRNLETSAEFLLDIAQISGHIAVVGATRSGKSNFVYSMLTQLISLPWVCICGVDPTDLVLGPLHNTDNLMVSTASNPCDAVEYVEVLRRLTAEMKRRISLLPDLGTDKFGIDHFTEEMPLLLVVLEEFPGILRRLRHYDQQNALKGTARAEMQFSALVA